MIRLILCYIHYALEKYLLNQYNKHEITKRNFTNTDLFFCSHLNLNQSLSKIIHLATENSLGFLA